MVPRLEPGPAIAFVQLSGEEGCLHNGSDEDTKLPVRCILQVWTSTEDTSDAHTMRNVLHSIGL